MKYSSLVKLIGLFSFLMVTLQVKSNPKITSYISSEPLKGSFPLFTAGRVPAIYLSSDDYTGVIRAAKDFQSDLKRVADLEPLLSFAKNPGEKQIIIIGTIGKNPILDQLISTKKLDVSTISGRWETFLIQTIEKPLPGIDKALVIVGSDKRGTIFGIYDVSENIGVSPWYWWADVPVQHKTGLYVLPGPHSLGEPKVKYRGIFINDEAPALSGWVYEKFGGFNHKFYEKVFELILRLKGNYLWPAMWGNAFNKDDSISPILANEYGVVMGTSHHEPMLRAQQEWKKFGSGPWNYQTNETTLKSFWRQGIQNMGDHESIITIGMRGDGDMPMSEESNINLLERIVKDQREIIKEVTGKSPSEVPQLWALYKEVQDYYDKGMRVPDDVTLLLCDDNWGNIRKLPNLNEMPRSGGYGVYYHFDYVGGPRNYKWLNTNPVPRIWEQMHLAYQYGVNKIWIVNVGDIKPMEFPISFFLDYAWNPDKISADDITYYTNTWVKKQFGSKYTNDIAEIISKYLKYNARRKPELLSPETYSIVNYREAETVVSDYNALLSKADSIYKLIATEYKDAYFQLVLHPVKACANLNELYFTVAKNRQYALQGRAGTNVLADSARKLFLKDAEISKYYNKIMSGGKWNHMMDQTHIGYTYWQQPDSNSCPEVKRIEIPAVSEMGISMEGSDAWWPKNMDSLKLPQFNVYQNQTYYIELFNRGSVPYNYSIKPNVAWLTISSLSGNVENEKRIWLKVNWEKAPKGIQTAKLVISTDSGKQAKVDIQTMNPEHPSKNELNGFIETNDYISIEAIHYSKAIAQEPLKWQIIPDLGRTLSAISVFPVNSKAIMPDATSPRLEYQVFIVDTGKINVKVYLSPILNFMGKDGLSYGISFDNEPAKIVNVHADKSLKTWEKWVADNINISASEHHINQIGYHTLKFWMIDPRLVLQKIVIDCNGVKPSYLGPPESYYRFTKK